MAALVRKTGEFTAIDSEGEPLQIEILQEFWLHQGHERPGPMRLRTLDGVAVRRLAQGIYQIPQASGGLMRITSNDPHAP